MEQAAEALQARAPTKILVCGGRKFADRQWLYRVLDSALKRYGALVIINGGAPGADTLAREWAFERLQPAITYPARWDDIRPGVRVKTRRDGTRYNADAGHERNSLMLSDGKPNLVIAFPGGAGTANMVAQARDNKVQLVQYRNVLTDGSSLWCY